MNEVSAPCAPTEDHDKVFGSIINIFPDAVLNIEGDVVSGTFSELGNFKKLIREQRIKDTARQVLSHSVGSERITFYLNKQAAFVSKVNFTEGNSILGDITVALISKKPEAMIIEITGIPEHPKDPKDQNNQKDQNNKGDGQ